MGDTTVGDGGRSAAEGARVASAADGDELALARARIERLVRALDAEREALQRSEDRFRAVQEAASTPFLVERALRDATERVVDFELVWANTAARARGGAFTELGARLTHVLESTERDGTLDCFARVLASGTTEARAVTLETGSERCRIELHAVRLGRDLLGLTAQLVDERHAAERERTALLARERRARAEAEAALQSSQTTLALLDGVLDNSPSGVAFFDRDLRYIRVNRALARMTGRHPEAHVGRTLRDTAPELAPLLEPLLIRVLTEGATFSQPISRGSEDDDTRRDWLGNLFPVYSPDGAILGVGLDTVEITELARARRHAEELARQLEGAASEREALLVRERDAREEAEVANRLKDEFLAIVSHELRTPLHAIRGWASLAKNGGALAKQAVPLDPMVRKALDVIDRNAEAQARIIDDLLDASRIIAGKLALEVQTIDIATIARDAVEAARPSAVSKGITVMHAISARDACVVADLGRVRQVMSNLLSNALKFTPRGGRVTIAVQPEADEVRIEIRDTGAGIAAELLPHVFDRFRQGEQATTRRHGGLGLGLSIVRQIVELHGGTVRAESEGSGLGATFTIVLPRRPPRSTPLAVRPPKPMRASTPVLRSYRVVVVDDEVDARDLASVALCEAGAEVDVAGSVAEALEVIRQVRPHAIISDIGMPGADGYELVRRLRASEVLTPIVALTAYAGAADAERAQAAGFDAHLTKPVEPAQLVGVIAKLLGEEETIPGFGSGLGMDPS
ncbi:Chemotaxis protein methyltransferase CheR [Sandaracinus amylolyticus]|uniref:histidine kinase n=2 Tax=Sandaracinus amylolyticus TaxID=927083 RepID=A0A0F6W019_9BACT|nr:Chemotaxis protein methyltransferase CheR [Sandaracinus amylolyticus]